VIHILLFINVTTVPVSPGVAHDKDLFKKYIHISKFVKIMFIPIIITVTKYLNDRANSNSEIIIQLLVQMTTFLIFSLLKP